MHVSVTNHQSIYISTNELTMLSYGCGYLLLSAWPALRINSICTSTCIYCQPVSVIHRLNVILLFGSNYIHKNFSSYLQIVFQYI